MKQRLRILLNIYLMIVPVAYAHAAMFQKVSDDFKSFEVDIKSRSIPLSDLVEEVEIVRLEETSSSLLSYVFNLEIEGDKYVFPSGDQGDIYVYAKDGSLIRKINKIGNGPGEYPSIDDFWTSDGQIYVYSRNLKQLRQYSIEGKFIKSQRLPYRAAHVYQNGAGYVLDMEMNYIEDSLKYNVVLLDENLEAVALLNPYKASEVRQYGFYMSQRSLRPYRESVLYSRILHDSLYLISNGQIKPFMSFDFGGDWLWKKESKTRETALQAMQDKGLVWHVNATVGSRYVYLNCMTSYTAISAVLIDRLSGNVQPIRFEEPIVMGAIKWDQERLLVSIQSEDVAGLIGSLGKNQWKFRTGTTLEEIESSENPVLMWIRFK